MSPIDNCQNKKSIEVPEDINLHLGKKLRKRRKILGLTQTEVGESIGIRFQQVQKYECGANRISAEKLYKLAELLNVPITYFYDTLESTISDEEYTAQNENEISLLENFRKLKLALRKSTLEQIERVVENKNDDFKVADFSKKAFEYISKENTSPDFGTPDFIAEQLKKIRLRNGLSQENLGDSVGVRFQQIQKYECGVNQVSAGRLYKLAQALNVSVETLFGSEKMAQQTTTINQSESRLLLGYRLLPENIRPMILSLIEAIVSK